MKIAHTTAYNQLNVYLFVYSLVVLNIAFVACYMYFVSTAIVHVVMRTETEHAIATAHSELSELETKLMLAQHRVSAEIASLSGYTEPTARVFIDRGVDSVVVRNDIAP